MDGCDNNVHLFAGLDLIADAAEDRRASEKLATLFRQRSRISTATPDHHPHSDAFSELFGNASLIAIKADDAPLWQVPVKVCLYVIFWLSVLLI